MRIIKLLYAFCVKRGHMTKVFIDGGAGTTGLRINERLAGRKDIELIILPDEIRKDTSARKEALNSADIALLCLPDDAAIEAVSLIENSTTAVIDTSTAHRTNPAWDYGFPEIANRREKIRNSKRIANPGCHASGFIAICEPLVSAGIISKDAHLSCFSLTGYSGGGKKMIAEYEDESRNILLDAPRAYGITQKHKHLPEMSVITGMSTKPVFLPVVGDFYSGMEVTIPLFECDIKGTLDDIKNVYRDYYKGERLVHFDESADEGGFLASNAYSTRDDMQICANGSDGRIILTARYDNLGKGASGSALQNLNILMGVDETTGLVTE